MLREECKKNQFKLGINFDMNLLDEIIKLNNESKENKITELYGSDSNNSFLAARPAFRLPDVELEEMEAYIKKAKDNGIDFNYTMNSMFPFMSKKELCNNLDYIINFIKILQEIGVYRLTVANPIMLEIIRKYAKSDIEIEISTCAHIETVSQIKFYHEEYGVNKVCGNLNKNRDFEFLKSASDYCNKNGIIYELMANEFCGVGGNDYATHCIYRDSCYLCHASNDTYEDSLLLNNYPMELCTLSRNRNITNWLKMKWIRPEDLKIYNGIGLYNFKITGRTGTSEYIRKTIGSYLKESFKGNLLELWKPLESIKPGVKESEVKSFYIDNDKLNGFINFWVINGHNCDYEVCGETCKYCNNFYELIK